VKRCHKRADDCSGILKALKRSGKSINGCAMFATFHVNLSAVETEFRVIPKHIK
jgi:hypothetical protein